MTHTVKKSSVRYSDKRSVLYVVTVRKKKSNAQTKRLELYTLCIKKEDAKLK